MKIGLRDTAQLTTIWKDDDVIAGNGLTSPVKSHIVTTWNSDRFHTRRGGPYLLQNPRAASFRKHYPAKEDLEDFTVIPTAIKLTKVQIPAMGFGPKLINILVHPIDKN